MALDGENWMILPTPNPYAALMLEKLMYYLARAEDDGFIKVTKPSTVVNEATETIEGIPTTSWLGSPSKWTTERADVQSRLWSMAKQAIEKWGIYEEVFGPDNELRTAMAMALDSDFYWAEFVNQVHVGLWAHHVVDYVEKALSSIRINLSLVGNRLNVEVANDWHREASLLINVESQGISTEYPLRIMPNSKEDVQVSISNEAQISLLTAKTRQHIKNPIRVRA